MHSKIARIRYDNDIETTVQGKTVVFVYVRPAWAQSNGLKSLVCPSSGKDIAKGKGVVGDCESEGSWMANLWSDEQESYQVWQIDGEEDCVLTWGDLMNIIKAIKHLRLWLK